MKRRFSITLAAVFLLTFLCAGVPAQGLSAEEEIRGQAGTNVSGFCSVCTDGNTIDGSVFAGYSISIVTYWATWSGDALRQLGFLQQIHERRPDIGVFGLLHTDGTSTVEAASAYMAAHGYTFDVFPADAVWQGVVSQLAFMPQTFFVSPGGVILEAWPGAFGTADAMQSEAERWIGPVGTYSVRFYDSCFGSCDLIEAYTGLSYGSAVQAPQAPMHEGFRFMGWSTDAYGYVTDDIDVFALYAPLPDGDVNLDGMLNSLDALELLRVVLGIVPELPRHLEHGDMDMDGALSGVDALYLMRIALGVLG